MSPSQLFALVLTVAGLSSVASAQSDCEKLAKAWNSGSSELEDVVDVDFSELDEAAVANLPELSAFQLMISAETYATKINPSAPLPVPNPTAFQALNYLKDHSSNSEGALKSMILGDIIANYVEHYPGDNAYGYVFKSLTSELIATIQDGEFVCE